MISQKADHFRNKLLLTKGLSLTRFDVFSYLIVGRLISLLPHLKSRKLLFDILRSQRKQRLWGVKEVVQQLLK